MKIRISLFRLPMFPNVLQYILYLGHTFPSWGHEVQTCTSTYYLYVVIVQSTFSLGRLIFEVISWDLHLGRRHLTQHIM